MTRFLGNVSTPLTYKVNSQSALDPRIVVDTKEELTKAETWPRSGESTYVYDGQVVYVKSEQCAYALVDKNNYTDVNSWKYVGGYVDIYAYDIKLEAIQDTSKIVTGKLTFDMISNTTTVGGIYYDENNNYFYRTVQIGGATGSVETRYYLTWGDLGDNIVTSEELGEVKGGKTYPKANTTYYCEYQDADGKQDFTIPSDFNGFVSGKLYISVLNGKMYKASNTNSLITVSGGDSSYLLNRLIALEKAGAEDDVLEFNGMVNTEDIVESSVAANNYTIMFDTHNKQFVAYENGVYYANWKENDFNKPSAAYGEKMYSGIKPTAGKIYIDISTNQIYRWNGVDLIALNATADSIKIGKNDDGNTYKIALNSDGSGHLANKGIEWNAEGDVTFGQNVTLNWSNIENPPTPPAGEGTFKSTVFTRNNATPDTPTGGSYNNPKPDGNIWSDGIPDGEEILWASTRVFSTLGEDSELELVKEGWTDPKKMTDTASFNVEFSKLETPKAPTDFIDGETEEQWRAKNQDWENTSDKDTIWMATNTRKNGVWDGWQVSKIKGEKGDNGTSISIKKKANIVESIEKLPTSATIGDICFVGSIEDMDAVVLYVYQENDWVAQTGMQLGDSYLVDEWLFMWDGDSWIKSQFKGDPGKSSYIHIKYANSSNPGDWTGRGEEAGAPIIPDDKTSWGETPGAYMGVYSDNIETDSKNWNSYKWTKWEGQDGMGYEYVYRTTTTNKAPELSENEYTKNEITYNPSNDGFIPENWSDDPISISRENPFCWMAVRQKLDGKWSSFKISLWSKWGSDSIKLDLDNDNDSIMYRDDTPISTVVSNATLYDGINPVDDKDVKYSIADWGTTEGSLDKNQITITSIGSSSTSVKIRAEYKENEYFAILSIKKLVNTDKYEIICSPNAIPHNIDEGDSQHTILVNTYKTNFETGVRELLTELPKGYALICNINDSNSGDDNVTIVNNQYILDITDTNKPDSLTFILKKGEEVLDSETIPVNYTKNGEKGADGKDGEDGVGVSSIKTQYAISNDPINHPDDTDENWTDNSPAVNKDSQYLWQRLKTIYTNNTESAWSYNVVGRMGEKGIDGDSVEYVYSRTNENKAPQKPIGTEPIENNNGTWTDDPQGVSDTNKYEWISEHKKVGGVWQEYSEPSLWAKWGEDGISPNSAFKSTVFTRTNETPSLPTGGSYDNPKPDGDIWTDGIPDGEEILWASTRIFSTDGKAPQQAEWTDPRKMTDTSDFDVEYSSKESPNKPSGHPNTNTDDWSNIANEETIWMATSTCKNGVWGDWKVSKIKGEKGEDGQSIKVAGHYKDLAAFEAVWRKDGQWVTPENTSDCYVVGTNLYVWDGDSWEDVGPFKGDKGEKGDTYILYVRYSASPNGTNMSTVPNKYIGVASSKETTAPTSPSDYTWTKWKGDDGYGYDYIYIRTKSSDTEDVPTLPNIDNWENDQDYQKDTYIPENWSDDPQDVDKDNPYCWMCYRQKVDGVWQQYKGSATNPGKPSLWTRWAKDGAGIESVTRKYLITADTDEDGNDITIEKIKELYGPTNAAWQLNSPTVTPDQPLLVEWIHTEYTSGGADEDYAFIGRMGAPGLDGSLIEYIYILTETIDKTISVPEENSPSINTNELGKWTDDPQSVSKEYPYQWISEREFDRTQNKWGNYSKPVLWSIWSKGENSVHLDLDNEMDSFLYDGNGNLLSNIITTTPTLYDGLNPVTEGIKWEVSAPDSEKNTNEDTFYSFDDKSGILTVNKMSAAENTVVYSITATYKDAKYVSSLTIKKLVGVDKYDLVVTPNSITYNTSIGDESASTKSVNIQVYRTSQGEGRKLITNLNSYKPIEIHVDGTDISAEYLEDGYTFTPDYTKSSIEIDLIKDGIVVDTETIPINKSKDGDNGTNGSNAIRLDLDNENDSMLYDGSNNCISGNVISNVSLYDGTEVVEIDKYDLNITPTNCTADINGNTITVSTMSSDSDTANVKVTAVYNDKEYNTQLNIKKLIGIDKFELSVTPNSITYNTSTAELSSSDIYIGIYRTSQSEGRKLVTDTSIYGLKLYLNNETISRIFLYNSANADNETGISKYKYTINPDYLQKNNDVKFTLTDSNGMVLDTETIPINKSKDGAAGANAIRLDLDNENDSMLYDGSGNCISGAVTSRARLYDGDKEVAASDVTWVISGCKGVNLVGGGAAQDADYTNKGVTNAWITVEGKITINGVNESTSYVQVRATYQDNHYYTTLSIKKLVNADKYELKVTPNAIAYNSSTSLPETVKLTAMVYKTTVDKPLPTLSDLPSGYGVFVISESMNGYNMNKPDATVGTYETEILIEDYLSDGAVQIFIGKSPNISDGILDIETIPINKSKNGTNGKDGADGKDGENGENAVTYEIVPTNSYYIVDPNKNSENINCVIQGYLYKIDGNSRTVVPNAKLIGGYSNTIDGASRVEESTNNAGYFSFGTDADNWSTSTDTWDDDNCLNSLSYIVRYEYNSKILAQYSVNMAKNGMAGTSGKQSAPLRVSEWSAGTTYYSGYEENAPWSDTVIYKDSASNTKQYYRCMKFHIAKDENAPGVVQSDNTKYWELYGGKFESVATGLLLAEKAYIDNLGVRSLSTNVTGERFTATGTEIAFYGKREYPAMRMSVDVFGKGRLEFLNQDTGEVTYVINEEGIKKWEEIINTSVNEIISPAVTTYRMISNPDGLDSAEQDWANYASNIFENDTTSTTDLYKYVAGRNSAGVVTETKYCISVEFSKNSDGRYFIFKPTDTQLLGSNAGSDGVTRYPYTGFFVKPDNVIHTQIRAYTNCTEGDTKSIPDDYNEHNNTLDVDWSVVETYNDPNGYNGFRYKNPIQDTHVYRMYNGEFVNANKWDDPDPTVGQTPLHVYRNKYEYVEDFDGGIRWKEWDDPEIHYVYEGDLRYGYPI